jgi:hypothetical protein
MSKLQLAINQTYQYQVNSCDINWLPAIWPNMVMGISQGFYNLQHIAVIAGFDRTR